VYRRLVLENIWQQRYILLPPLGSFNATNSRSLPDGSALKKTMSALLSVLSLLEPAQVTTMTRLRLGRLKNRGLISGEGRYFSIHHRVRPALGLKIFMDFRKFAFLQYLFYLNNFYSRI
jgi:hypothetical protein